MRLSTLLLGVLALFSCAASSGATFSGPVEDFLVEYEVMELLALHPYPHEEQGRPSDPSEDFHGYRILGRAPLADRVERAELIDAVERGVRKSDGTVAACFNPRHGIRLQRGTVTVDFVICYECLSLIIHGPGTASESHATSQSPERALSKIFEDAGLVLHAD